MEGKVIASGEYATVVAGEPSIAVKITDSYQHTALREIIFLTRCAHPNVCALKGFEMAALDGVVTIMLSLERHRCSLADEWGRGPPVIALAISRCADLAAAVSHVHAAGVIHADIKPNNILVAEDGRLVLCDFGISLDVAEPVHTRSVVSLGYRAPELETTAGCYGPEIDVWSVGVVMVEICRGGTIGWTSQSRDARTMAAQLLGVGMMHLKTPVTRERLEVLAPGADALYAQIQRALTPIPAERVTARELAESFGRTTTDIRAAATTPGSRRRMVSLLVPSYALAFADELAECGGTVRAQCMVAGSITRGARHIYQNAHGDDEATVCHDAIELLRAWVARAG